VQFGAVPRKPPLCSNKLDLFYCFYREILCLNDGGEVALDWLEKGCAQDAPIVIILPGLTGCSQVIYFVSKLSASF
jgi:predicted alpha/beta-fold hydrolase